MTSLPYPCRCLSAPGCLRPHALKDPGERVLHAHANQCYSDVAGGPNTQARWPAVLPCHRANFPILCPFTFSILRQLISRIPTNLAIFASTLHLQPVFAFADRPSFLIKHTYYDAHIEPIPIVHQLFQFAFTALHLDPIRAISRFTAHLTISNAVEDDIKARLPHPPHLSSCEATAV